MKVGIHLQGTSESIQNSPFERKFIDILEYNNIDFLILNINERDFWDKLRYIDLFIFRHGGISSELQLANTIMPIIENQLGINCFPNQSTCWHFDDKIKQYYLLKIHDFPIIQSWVFWDRQKCLHWIESETNFPVVFKLKGGAGSSNVVLLKNKKQAKKIVSKIFVAGIKNQKIPSSNAIHCKYFNLSQFFLNNLKKLGRKIKGWETERYWMPNIGYALFQRYLPNNDYDTRVLIIGNRAFAFRRMNRKNDFRSSGSGLIDYDPKMIDINHINKAFEVSLKMKFQSMAYDFLYNENRESEFCEISYSYIDTAVFNCPGYWDIKLNWHEGHFWPQYFILKDLLSTPDLKQPLLKQEDYSSLSDFQTLKRVFFNGNK